MSFLLNRIIYLAVFLAVCFSAGGFAIAQTVLTQEAHLFADEIDVDAVNVSEEDWVDYERKISLLPPETRLERSQDLAFNYLVKSRNSNFDRVFSDYRGILEEWGSDEQRSTQKIIDAFAIGSETGDYGQSSDEIKSLINFEALTDSQQLRAHVALAYAHAENGAQSEALQSLYFAKSFSRRIELSKINKLELETLTANVLIASKDYTGVLSAMRESAVAHDAYGMPFDGSRMISNTIWLLRDAGEFEAARSISEKFAGVESFAEYSETGGFAEADEFSVAESSGEAGNRTGSKNAAQAAAGQRPRDVKQFTSGDTTGLKERKALSGSLTSATSRAGDLSADRRGDELAEERLSTSKLNLKLFTVFIMLAVSGVISVIVHRVLIKRRAANMTPDAGGDLSELNDLIEEEAEEEVPEALVVPQVDVEELHVDNPVPGMLAGMSVLIVDDKPINVEVISGFMEIFGLDKYYVATNGLEAVSIASQVRLSLILMDIQMPVMNGLDAAAEIRKIPSAKDVPIVAVTGFSRIVTAQMCAAVGMNGFLTKPVDIDVLEKQVRKAFGQKHPTTLKERSDGPTA